jgi:hypothetical protein
MSGKLGTPDGDAHTRARPRNGPDQVTTQEA